MKRQGLKLLDGVKVVELATFVAAPTSTRVLADWGADVIKVEAPSGDYMRHMGGLLNMPATDDENIAFDQQNSNKRGVILNLKSSEGMQVLWKLLGGADVFVTNNRDAALKKLGLSYEQLRERFPRLVYGQISGYGDKGPDKAKPGYDFTAYYARGGISGTLYEKGGPPMATVAAFGDTQAGTYLAGGLCAALLRAAKTGMGEKVTVNLMHTAIFSMGHMIASAQYGGNAYPRSRFETLNPFQAAYESRDGRWLQMAMHNYDQAYPHMCKIIGREDLIEDERFCTFQVVKENPRPFIEIMDTCMKEKDADEWLRIFDELDLPVAKEVLWDEILEDEQAWANHMLSRVGGFPDGEERVVVNSPVQFAQAGELVFTKGPKPGEHTEEVLRECGYTPEEIAEMKRNQAVR